jgi:hypothetical protein
VKKVLLALSLLAVIGLLSVCEKREDFPQMLNVTVPPQPDSLVVEKLDATNYHLTWTIDDPNNVVKEYRVWSVNRFTPPDTIGTTVELKADVNTVIPISGLVFGVSSITIENVESDLTIQAAPE